jgi:hypothetical protein
MLGGHRRGLENASGTRRTLDPASHRSILAPSAVRPARPVEKLPTLVPTSEPNSEPNTAELRRTGTDDGLITVIPLRPDSHKGSTGGRSDAVSDAVPDAVTYRLGLHSSALSFTSDDVGKESVESPQVFETQARTNSHQVAAIGESEGGGNRTHDQRIKSPLLYQLSYAFIARFVPAQYFC